LVALRRALRDRLGIFGNLKVSATDRFPISYFLSTVCCLLLITKFLDTENGFTYILPAFIEQGETFRLFLRYRSTSAVDLRRIG